MDTTRAAHGAGRAEKDFHHMAMTTVHTSNDATSRTEADPVVSRSGDDGIRERVSR
jgi:hypothetical protein